MYKIEDNLYQGGVVKDLSEKITAVVSLLHYDEMDLQSYDEPVKVIVQLPIFDGISPGMSWLQNAVDIVQALLKNGHCVYIHCRAGISRSSMLTAAVLMKEKGWKRDKALEYIAKVNSSIDPALRFLSLLTSWEEKLGI